MQTYTFALHGSPNCLFKWQVIPTKQITPAGAWAYVVFLQQIVALPNKQLLPSKYKGLPKKHRRTVLKMRHFASCLSFFISEQYFYTGGF
jgi:hypothetical protein